ncbi:hypothetical protein J2Y49_004413 [Azospirillum sp. BE72]|nr:hypothetical protein [Azospirillum sp. BE72]
MYCITLFRLVRSNNIKPVPAKRQPTGTLKIIPTRKGAKEILIYPTGLRYPTGWYASFKKLVYLLQRCGLPVHHAGMICLQPKTTPRFQEISDERPHCHCSPQKERQNGRFSSRGGPCLAEGGVRRTVKQTGLAKDISTIMSKRTADVAISIIRVMVFLPMMALLCLIIIRDGGPVFFWPSAALGAEESLSSASPDHSSVFWNSCSKAR